MVEGILRQLPVKGRRFFAERSAHQGWFVRLSNSDSALTICRLLVITVMLLKRESRGTICKTVLPASRMIESPSWIKLTAASAISSFLWVMISVFVIDWRIGFVFIQHHAAIGTNNGSGVFQGYEVFAYCRACGVKYCANSSTDIFPAFADTPEWPPDADGWFHGRDSLI